MRCQGLSVRVSRSWGLGNSRPHRHRLDICGLIGWGAVRPFYILSAGLMTHNYLFNLITFLMLMLV